MNFDGLPATISVLHVDFDTRTIRDRALPEVSQYVGMKQNIRAAFIGDHKPKSLYRIKPLNSPPYSALVISICCHVVLPRSLIPKTHISHLLTHHGHDATRKRIYIQSFAFGVTPNSRTQTVYSPLTIDRFTPPNKAIMQPKRTICPEFHLQRGNPVAAPKWWARRVRSFRGRYLGHIRHELGTRREWLRLLRRPGSKAAL